MRIVPTNKFLFKVQLSTTNLCNFCNMQVESIEHLFWECYHVQTLWNRLSNYLAAKGILVVFNLEGISFGVVQTGFKSNSINFMIYLMKYFIFQMKNRQNVHVFEQFILYKNQTLSRKRNST